MIVEKRSKALSQRGPSLRYLVLHRNPIDFRGRQLLHRGSTLIENCGNYQQLISAWPQKLCRANQIAEVRQIIGTKFVSYTTLRVLGPK